MSEITGYDEKVFSRIKEHCSTATEHRGDFDFNKVCTICFALDFSVELTVLALEKARIPLDCKTDKEHYAKIKAIDKYSGSLSIAEANAYPCLTGVPLFGPNSGGTYQNIVWPEGASKEFVQDTVQKQIKIHVMKDRDSVS